MAQQLANFTKHLEIIDCSKHLTDNNTTYLQLDQQGLAICGISSTPLYVSTIYKKLRERYLTAKKDLLVQTIDLKPANKYTVWDLTAGFGFDGFILGAAGYNVVMVEYNVLIATILYYAQQNLLPQKENIKLYFANSIDFLTNNDTRPDIIYLDPMFTDNQQAKAK
jgi:16S rRNA (guanine1516-N2)-methyltransferase